VTAPTAGHGAAAGDGAVGVGAHDLSRHRDARGAGRVNCPTAKRPASSTRCRRRSRRTDEVEPCRATTRRWFQLVAQSGAVPLIAVGGVMVLRANGVDVSIGALMLLTVVVLVAIEIRYPLGWEAVYKGHAIRFRNHPIFGERALCRWSTGGSRSVRSQRDTARYDRAGSRRLRAHHCARPIVCHLLFMQDSRWNRSRLRRRPLGCLRHETREFAG